MRIALILVLALLAGCGAPDKYSKEPQPKGPWLPANSDPNSIDNNILPDFAQGVVSS